MKILILLLALVLGLPVAAGAQSAVSVDSGRPTFLTSKIARAQLLGHWQVLEVFSTMAYGGKLSFYSKAGAEVEYTSFTLEADGSVSDEPTSDDYVRSMKEATGKDPMGTAMWTWDVSKQVLRIVDEFGIIHDWYIAAVDANNLLASLPQLVRGDDPDGGTFVEEIVWLTRSR